MSRRERRHRRLRFADAFLAKTFATFASEARFQKTQNSPAKFRAQRAENIEKRRLDSTPAARQRR
jgi:hypothetical protein